MAHFAELNHMSQVIRVIVVDNKELLDENGVEQEHLGVEFCRRLLGGTWVQTSYNAKFRGMFAGAGYWYDPTNDVFTLPDNQPFIEVVDLSSASGGEAIAISGDMYYSGSYLASGSGDTL